MRPVGFERNVSRTTGRDTPLYYGLCYGRWFRSTDLWVMSPAQFLYATPYMAPLAGTNILSWKNPVQFYFQELPENLKGKPRNRPYHSNTMIDPVRNKYIIIIAVNGYTERYPKLRI